MMRWMGIPLLVLTFCALILRAPQLERRPMHNDEAVNALKVDGLWEKGVYRYDPNEYHGPTLYYATLPAIWLSGAKDFSQVSATTLRLVPVVFGAGLVLLLWLMADGLGRAGTILAGLLTVVSPALVFYSRYFIHEMLLVWCTLLLLAAGWRYSRSRRLGWALLGGMALGLMYATKETFVLALAAMAGAAVLTLLWDRLGRKRGSGGTAPMNLEGPTLWSELRGLWHWRHALAALLVAALVSGLFFTSFFTQWSGPLDSLRSYVPWLRRAGGDSSHLHPWYFYLERLLWFHHGRGPICTEAVILVLAAIGFVAALRDRLLSHARVHLVRFLGFYAVLLMGFYSGISYKTPWCLLGFWHGLILLAGAGAVTLLNWRTTRWAQAALSALLVFATAHLLWQAVRTSYVFPADRHNPYAYAQTSPDILELVGKVEALAKVDPQHDRMLIKVMVPGGDYWPLPWYLRQFKQVGWWEDLPRDPLAPVMIAGPKFDEALEELADSSHTLTGIYSLRPQVFLNLYVETNLWDRFIATNQAHAKK